MSKTTKTNEALLHPDNRASIVETIQDYAQRGGDPDLLEIVGLNFCRTDATDEQERAVIAAMVPTLSDERLITVLAHAADALVTGRATLEQAVRS